MATPVLCIGLHHPRHLPDQDFGLAMPPEHTVTPAMGQSVFGDYHRPWKHAMGGREIGSVIKTDKDKFQINLDVQHFAPDEISVKTADGFVYIEGKHDEKQDNHGYVSRQFTRRYAFPKDVNPEAVMCKLSADGVLTVVAPLAAQQLKNERSVPIIQTGPVKKEIKEPADPVADPIAVPVGTESNEPPK